MVRIPTPIPEAVAERVSTFFGASMWLWLYRSVLIIVSLAVLIAALSSFGAFVGILVGIVVSVVLADDIRAVIRDVWDLNFWVFKT